MTDPTALARQVLADMPALHKSLVASVAMSLYRFNVSPAERASRLYEAFDGVCAELDELVRMVDCPQWATRMAVPTAALYLAHACDRYGEEAEGRVAANLEGL